jgi:4-hydroxy-tetrahydrodipicolinate synthase
MLTPFKDDESIDEGPLRGHVNWLIDQGVHGIICTGSTGEAASMSAEERRRVMQITVEEARGRLPVLAGPGANSTAHTIMYSQYAESVGADGLMIVHPYYCLPTERELYEHYRAVAESVQLPIMIYNNPYTTGVDMKPALLARLSEIDNVRYVKEATVDVKRVGQIKLACGDRISIFQGCDNIAFESFVMGADGWVSGAANIIPRQCVELYELTIKGDIDAAKELAYRMLPLTDMCEVEGLFIQCLKEGSKLLGRPLGRLRRPLLPLEETDLQRLRDALDLIT